MSKVRLLVIVSLIVACALIAAGAAIAAACGDSSPASTVPGLQMVGNDPALPTVAVVTTGGTIAEKIDPQTGGAVPSVSGADLVAAVPGLTKLANIAVLSFCNIDSSQMTPQIWANLSRKVAEILKMPAIKGVVVTHGTDTMEEGAYFLDLTLPTGKPVVFTGAMNNASSPFPDGPGNLYNAVVQVCAENTEDWGVTVTLNSYVNPAREVRKTQTTNVQTFESGEKGYLGYIFGNQVQRFDSRTDGPTLPVPDKLPKVVYLATYAGDDGALVRYAVDSGAQGLVIDAVGAGNVNAAVNEAVKYALSKKIPVVIASRVQEGEVEPIYGGPGGSKTLLDEGCILAGDLLGGKARLLLMLGIAEHGNDVKELKKLFR
jgi:L-asparaginase